MLVPQKSVRAMVLIMILCLSSLPAQSREAGKSDKTKPGVSSPTPQLAGKLVTRGNQPVVVNGYIVGTGTTILTGATIQTFNGTRAFVQLGALGNFELSPNSTATLAFGTNQVTGMLKRGCATLTTNASIAGALSTPDGILTRTDETKLSSINVCAPGSEDAAQVQPDLDNGASANSGRRGIFGAFPNSGTTMGLLGAATYFAGVGTIKANNNGSNNNCCYCCCCCNPSPSKP